MLFCSAVVIIWTTSLIQDSEVFPVLEVIPEADLPVGITASVRGHLSLLLFPESPFPPLFHSAKMGTVI